MFLTYLRRELLSAQENVEAALVPLHTSPAARRRRAVAALETVGLVE